MPLGLTSTGPSINTQRGQQFIPEQWINEIQMFRKARMLDTSIVKTWGANVKKGDTFHVPRISELGVEDKATDTPVSLQPTQDTDFVITVDTDRVTAVGLDDLLEIESDYALRAPYLGAMGYALAKDVTACILGLRAAVYANAAANVFCSSNGLLTGNGQAFNLAGFLAARRILLESDVPEENMRLLVSPGQESAIFLIQQFVSKDFINNQPFVDGQIGNLMGVPVIRTSVIGANSPTGYRNGALAVPEPTPGFAGSRYLPRQDAFTSLPATFTGNSRPVHTALLCQEEWAAAVMTKAPKMTQSFENRDQIHLMVGRQAYGARLYRPGHAINIHSTGDTV